MAAVAVAVPRTSSPTIDSQRTSMISTSVSSFQTAQSDLRTPSVAHSFQSSSHSSSFHTLPAHSPPAPDFVNPIHVLARRSQEIHVVKVTEDTIQLESG